MPNGPRTDCPAVLPSPPSELPPAFIGRESEIGGHRPIPDLVRDGLHLALALSGAASTPADVQRLMEVHGIDTEAEAGMWIHDHVRRFKDAAAAALLHPQPQQ
jgi:hypothetical protein